jgi:capsular exopolysaccharide synthesis family protein
MTRRGARRADADSGLASGGVDLRESGQVASDQAVPIISSLLKEKNWFIGEELRLLAARVHDLRRDKGVACLAITSALPSDGKSTVSVGLAAALAREPGRRVLLIEADVRRPSLNKTLHLPPAPGLGEYLNGSAEHVPIRIVEPGGFSLLVAGQAELHRPESLSSKRMSRLVRTARGRYDFVLLDAPPLIPVADSVLIQDMVDGFLLVVRSRQTPRAAIDEAVAKLRADAILGLVLNDHRVYRDSYRAYAYERYGASAPRSTNGTHGPHRRLDGGKDTDGP